MGLGAGLSRGIGFGNAPVDPALPDARAAALNERVDNRVDAIQAVAAYDRAVIAASRSIASMIASAAAAEARDQRVGQPGLVSVYLLAGPFLRQEHE